MADVSDELAKSSALTREDLLKRGAAAAFAVGMFGALPDKALGFYGPLRFKHKQQAGELRIMTWAHFVPAYDTWLDGTYAKRWGEENDVEVKIDHINNALLFGNGSAEVASGDGHDLHWFISPPSSFQKQVVPVTDLVQEVTKRFGPMAKVAKKSTYNPRTKQFFGFPETYAPDPVQYRRSHLQQAGVSLNTWDDLRRGAARLKEQGHPVGLGMSNEIDSNMLLTSLLYCYGGFIQNEANRIVFNQGSNRRGAIQALQVMREIYRTGMTDEVFAWTAASNNNAFVAGRLSVALNAISIVRTAEKSGNQALADDTWLASIPRGPAMRLGNEHVMGVYVIWKFSKNKEAARKYLIDQQLNYRAALRSQRVLQLPAVDELDQGRVRDDPQDRCDGHAQAEGEVHRPDDDRREVHDEPRPSGPLERGDRRDLQHVHDPADVRPGRAGEGDPGRRRQGVRHQGEGDLPQVEGAGAGLALLFATIRGPRASGPSPYLEPDDRLAPASLSVPGRADLVERERLDVDPDPARCKLLGDIEVRLPALVVREGEVGVAEDREPLSADGGRREGRLRPRRLADVDDSRSRGGCVHGCPHRLAPERVDDERRPVPTGCLAKLLREVVCRRARTVSSAPSSRAALEPVGVAACGNDPLGSEQARGLDRDRAHGSRRPEYEHPVIRPHRSHLGEGQPAGDPGNACRGGHGFVDSLGHGNGELRWEIDALGE